MKKIISLFAVVVIMCVVLAAPAAAAAPHKGDLLHELPAFNTRKDVSLIDNSKLQDGEFTMSWEAFEGAEKYSVRVFFNIYRTDKNIGLEFMFREEYITEETTLTISGLKPLTRYTIIVYALDEAGNEIATYDRMPLCTVEGWGIHDDEEGLEEQNAEGKEKEGISTTLLIVIIVAAVVVIAIVVVMIIVLSADKKKYANKE